MIDSVLGALALAAVAGPLVPERSLLEDPAGALDIAAASASTLAADFRPVADEVLAFGVTDSAWWVRVDFPAADVPRLLVVDYTQNDELDLFRRDGERWLHYAAGDTQARVAREVSYPLPVFRVPAGYAEPVYLRIVSQGNVLLPLQLWQEHTFWQHAVRVQWAYGLYYAILLALALYNLFLWTVIRDRAYLYYVGYLAGLIVFQGAWTGHAGWLFWPGWPGWINASTLVGLAVAIVSGCAFVATMAQTRLCAPKFHRGLAGAAALAIAAACLLPFSYRAAMLGMTALALLTLLIMTGAVLIAYRAGVRQARFLVLGLLAFMPGGVLLGLRSLDLIASNWWTEHLYQVGTAVEALLLSFALADRINLLETEKNQARQELNEQRAGAARQLLEAQDSERRRIAADLHDGLGQHLLVLISRLRRTADDGLVDMAHDALQEVRRIVRNLYPHQLDRLGLAAALESLVETSAQAAGVRVNINIDEVDLPRTESLQIYHIAQEALSNALRHGKPHRLWLCLRAGEGRLRMDIEDDGRGFPSRDAAAPGVGMAGMQARARQLSGRCTVTPRAGGGTHVCLDVPLPGAAP